MSVYTQNILIVVLWISRLVLGQASEQLQACGEAFYLASQVRLP